MLTFTQTPPKNKSEVWTAFYRCFPGLRQKKLGPESINDPSNGILMNMLLQISFEEFLLALKATVQLMDLFLLITRFLIYCRIIPMSIKSRHMPTGFQNVTFTIYPRTMKSSLHAPQVKNILYLHQNILKLIILSLRFYMPQIWVGLSIGRSWMLNVGVSFKKMGVLMFLA